ncbi:hypothetical protein [Chitinophaga solisilvae]|uniref:hypothetical protein n=1 Tax=Chitinophaga solisilvae TaxID=1233460 RepID=UPI00136DB938|nr:hypothetical protein [Chitinophaga solisilvae]
MPNLPNSLSILLSIFLMALFGCSKEYSRENGQADGGQRVAGTALYSFVTGSGVCSDAAATGIFKTGVNVTGTAFLRVTVNVSQPGTWTMTTGTVNGITFSGTGVFTSPGRQTIVLPATGTPRRDGVHVFPLRSPQMECNVMVVVSPAAAVADDYYYRMTVAGKPYEQHVREDNNYIASSGVDGVEEVVAGAGIVYNTRDDDPVPPGVTQLVITKALLYDYFNVTEAGFTAFFAKGDYPYATRKEFVYTSGITIRWQDEQGQIWDTISGDQPGSSFSILSAEPFRDGGGAYYVKVKMRFSCRLYNQETGAMKQVTGGEMTGNFGKI